jgi:hypothetical protein
MLELAWRQQFFAWGQDVVSDRGNLLIEYGLKKLPRVGSAKFSEYVWSGVTDAGDKAKERLCLHHVHLWAFGVCSVIDGKGALFYSRSSLLPWLVNEVPKSFPTSHDDWMLFLLEHQIDRSSEWDNKTLSMRNAFFDWVGHYESWIHSELGTAYRDNTTCIRNDAVVAGSELRNLWRTCFCNKALL